MGKQKKTKSGAGSSRIALNRKATHDFKLEQKFEAGLVLEGWEVKSIRANRIQLKESYVTLKHGEAWLIGAHISPMGNIAEHVKADPTRSRKLLLNKSELRKLIGAVERKGFALVPISMYWKKGKAKLEIALAKGKKEYDKRASIKDREGKREKERAIKEHK